MKLKDIIDAISVLLSAHFHGYQMILLTENEV